MTNDEIVVGVGIVTGLVILFLYERNASTESDSGNGNSVDIPALLAPVVTDKGLGCVGKTDAQGNWYGIDISGNCNIEAMGGTTGSY